VAAVALGLGRGVVEGGSCLRFSPRWPQHVPQLSSTEEALETTQRELWALDLEEEHREGEVGLREKAFPLGSPPKRTAPSPPWRPPIC
jgi:hypothetical protein